MPSIRPRVACVGVDTGGTFTDLVVAGTRGILQVHKVRSTPEDPSRAVIQGLAEMGLLEGGAPIIHGTTVATNALLQRRGSRTALVTTGGFEDVLVLGRQARPLLYRLDPPVRREWIPRRMRIGIKERRGSEGEAILPLRAEELRRLRATLRRLGVEAVAVCLLHAYANPAHERAVGRALKRRGWRVSLSHRIANEFREFERTCTTVANATLSGPMEDYLFRLHRRLGRRRLRVMASSGTWISGTRAAQQPVRTLLSGPAGGAGAAALLGREAGVSRLITLDMGGTSSDMSLCEGEVRRVSGVTLDGIPLRIPSLEIHSVGSGGGSIARADAGGALRVGPESAGATPGPAGYGRGGTQPTLTDAHLVLGRLPPEGLLDGALPLHPDPAVRALRRLGRSLGLTVEETALGILRVVEAGLERTIRGMTAARGRDPAACALLVFGGAGGLHACGVASRLGIRRILIPPEPGTFSALGLCASPAGWEGSRTVFLRARRHVPERIAAFLAPMIREGTRILAREGIPRGRWTILQEADLRYVGQSHELTLEVTPELTNSFHRLHRREFGYSRPGEEVEVVTVRVRITGPPPRLAFPRPVGLPASPGPLRVSTLLAEGDRREIPRYRREALSRGATLRGPILITEYSSTTFVAEGFSVRVAGDGHLVLDCASRRGGR